MLACPARGAKLVTTAPQLVAGAAGRSAWLRRAALLTGRAVGSARVRSLYL